MDADIVVGLDDSPWAWAAVTWEAYATPAASTVVFPDADALDPVWTVRARSVFAKLDPEPGWTLQFAKGHPGPVMVDTSRDASLLVLGTREHRGLGRLLKGSVSHYCINHAAGPVVAVPSAGQDAAPADAEVRAPAVTASPPRPDRASR